MKDIIQSMIDAAKGPHMVNTDNMKRFNDAVSEGDRLTHYSMDQDSVEKLIWLLVNLGYINQATELRQAAIAIGYIKEGVGAVKHTPGPWRIWRDMDPKEPIQICGMETDFICQIAGENTNAKANALLIAAAPEMLEALRVIANWEPDKAPNEGRGMSIIDAIDLARSVISKAEGKAP